MKTIKLKNLHIQNFKGCKDRTIEFGEKNRISGANATGKTTVFDSFAWLLFNKDSAGNAKFDIRPLDANGKMINNVEISVEAIISIDSEEYAIKKVQKQVWRKKRGTDTTEFQGNVNEFEINGYPKSEKEYKSFIDGIIDEKVFHLITNPIAFNSLPWKERREILMKFVGSFTDVEIAQRFGRRFEKLIPELRIASTDDVLKKYTKSKNTLNKQMDEIPARIDELSKQLANVNVAELEIQKSAKEVALKKIEDELSGGNGKLEEINQKRQSIMDLKMRQSSIQNKANEALDQKRCELRQGVDSISQKCREIRNQINDAVFQCDTYKNSMDRSEQEKIRLADEWKSWKAKTFPDFVPLDPFVGPEPLKEEDMICPTCGQALPLDVKKRRIEEHDIRREKAISDYSARCEAHKSKYEKEKSEFDALRDKTLKDITEKGQASADNVRKYKKLYEDKKSEIDSLNKSLQIAESERKDAENSLNQIPAYADVTGDVEYMEIQSKIENLENEISEMSKDTSGRTELEAKKVVIRDEIAEIDAEIKSADNSKVKVRIAELEEEKKSVGQRIAEQEQIIDLTENFIRAKMNMISEAINEKFGGKVTFKLFDTQINNGIRETCECQWNGKSDMSNGESIVAGLYIIKALSELYDVIAPVFVDNSEAISDGNFPELESQVIELRVSNDKELVVSC